MAKRLTERVWVEYQRVLCESGNLTRYFSASHINCTISVAHAWQNWFWPGWSGHYPGINCLGTGNCLVISVVVWHIYYMCIFVFTSVSLFSVHLRRDIYIIFYLFYLSQKIESGVNIMLHADTRLYRYVASFISSFISFSGNAALIGELQSFDN